MPSATMKTPFSLAVLCFAVKIYASQAPLIQDTISEAQAIALATFDLTETRLVHVFGEEEPRYMTEAEKLELHGVPIGFFDITNHPDFTSRVILPNTFVGPQSTSFNAENNRFVRSVEEDLADVIENLDTDITKLTSFWTRSYKSPWGLASSNWIFDYVSQPVSTHGIAAVNYTVSKFSHEFPQNSIIVRLESASSKIPSSERELVIISAHQDSLNYKYPFFRAPGADDDGSGSVAIIQVLRSLLEKGFVVPDDIAVEFHWYAAEEGGLLGSLDIASSYRDLDKPVKASLQMDCIGLTPPGSEPVIGIFDTNINANLTTFGTTLIDKYNSISWEYTNCGQMCGSDHMSWNFSGYPAMFVSEGPFHDPPLPYYDRIHTSRDIVGQPGWNLTHITEFVKLGLAFVTELAISDF